MMELRIKLLDERARLPRRAHPNDAGLDLAPLGGADLTPGETSKLRTGVAVEIPTGYFGMAVPRSSAKARGLDVLGIIDSDYRGEVHIVITNTGWREQIIRPGEFLAQLIIIPVATPCITIVNELSPTARADGGFGSSGT